MSSCTERRPLAARVAALSKVRGRSGRELDSRSVAVKRVARSFRRTAARCHTRALPGQSTVEAAFLVPVVFVLLLLLLQPSIVLYDRMVMNGAAAEGCRLLATRTSAAGADAEAYRSSVLRRLGSVPQEEHFHVHDGGGCSWEILLDGDESAGEVSVTVRNKIEPLPIVDAAATLLGLVDEGGHLTIEVSASAPSQPRWVVEGEAGLNPGAWVEERR